MGSDSMFLETPDGTCWTRPLQGPSSGPLRIIDLNPPSVDHPIRQTQVPGTRSDQAISPSSANAGPQGDCVRRHRGRAFHGGGPGAETQCLELEGGRAPGSALLMAFTPVLPAGCSAVDQQVPATASPLDPF
ncbi:hypothetical protein Landi51_07986 [Colletotrichum acutatum]